MERLPAREGPSSRLCVPENSQRIEQREDLADWRSGTDRIPIAEHAGWSL